MYRVGTYYCVSERAQNIVRVKIIRFRKINVIVNRKYTIPRVCLNYLCIINFDDKIYVKMYRGTRIITANTHYKYYLTDNERLKKKKTKYSIDLRA